MSEEPTIPDLVERTCVFVWVEGLVVPATHYNDIAQARAAAERLAEERA
jgi:hypothetical protein